MQNDIVLRHVETGTSIPKVIYQTGPTRNLLPFYQANIEHILATCEGYKYQFFDDDDVKQFIRDEYGHGVLDVYDSIDPRCGAARADLFRYLLIYLHGGVYLDLKSTVTRSLANTLLASDLYILSRWDNKQIGLEEYGLHDELASVGGCEFQQWHIIAAAGHPYLKSVIQRVVKNIQNYNIARDGFGRSGVLNLTGPIAYTLAISPNLDARIHRTVSSECDIGLRYSLYSRYNEHVSHPGHYTKGRYALVKPRGLSVLYTQAFIISDVLMRSSRLRLWWRSLQAKIQSLFLFGQ